MADALRGILTELQAHRREKAFAGAQPMSQWVLFPDLGDEAGLKDEQRIVKVIRRRMQTVLGVAGLPPHHTPHSLRHSFGSLLVSSGASLAYVKEQMGHASITMTVDVYGSAPQERRGRRQPSVPGRLGTKW
jgi:integrase